MKLYSGPLSLFSAKVRIALEEKGLEHELVQVGWSRVAAYQPHHPDVVALHPKRQVPVLVDGDVVVCDSTLICEYLEERHPAPALFPTGVVERARCRTQEWTADEVWFPHLWTLIAARVYGSGSEDEVPDAVRALQAHVRELERGLGTRDYFCGPFTVADIGSFVFLSTAIALGCPLPDDAPRVAAWCGRVAARRAVALVMQDVNAAAARLLQ
ncbi:glutathione S-transferase family protein [Candidatus Binatia bacterium]|jgi:glutathione S-transferase|nr:glutathione S-transferase family protein [Candidatus Binatia bacterium]